MKQLESQFVNHNHVFTLVKRSDKAAIYKRETQEGTLVSFEVFGILSKNDTEFYPNENFVGKTLWCPIKSERAETYFQRINDGDVIIPQLDAETGEMVRSEEDNKSLAELLSSEDVATVAVSLDDPTAPVSVTVTETDSPVVETVEDVTPEVEETPSGDTLVQVTAVKKTKTKITVEMNIPTGEFTQAQFAQANGLPERGVVWGKLDALVKAGKLRKEFKKIGKGRPSQVFVGV